MGVGRLPMLDGGALKKFLRKDKKEVGMMKDLIRSTFVFIFGLYLLQGCLKIEVKLDDEEASLHEVKLDDEEASLQKIEQDLKNLEVVLEPVRYVVLVSDTIRELTSNMRSAGKVKNTIILSRDVAKDEGITDRGIITARAPKLMRVSGGFCPAPKRIKGKVQDPCVQVCQFSECSVCGMGVEGSCDVKVCILDDSDEIKTWEVRITNEDGSEEIILGLSCDKEPVIECSGKRLFIEDVESLNCDLVYAELKSNYALCVFHWQKKFISCQHFLSSLESWYGYIIIGNHMINETCRATGCSYDLYMCDHHVNELLRYRCAPPLYEDFLEFVHSCKYLGEGSESASDYISRLYCYVADLDKDDEEDYIYLWSSEVYLEAREIQNYLSLHYCYDDHGSCALFTSSLRVGKENCVFSPSCDIGQKDFEGYVRSYVETLSSGCKLRQIGYYTQHEDEYRACFRMDVTGDGTEDVIVDRWKNNTGSSIIVQEDSVTKYECKEGFCLIYVPEDLSKCSIDECNISCKWLESGMTSFSDDGFFSCFKDDLDGDGSKELVLFSEHEGKDFISILSENISVLASCTGVDEKMECKLKFGKCGDISSCRDFQKGDLSALMRKRCSFSEKGTCKGYSECEGMIYSVVGYRSKGDFCHYTVDISTGEFREVRKTESGYEYKKGTTSEFVSVLCPKDSSVDLESCSISDCDPSDEADRTVFSITSFVERVTVQEFRYKVSKNDIEGEISVKYYNLKDEMMISGVLRVRNGKLQITAYVKSDGTADVVFSFVQDGVEMTGELSVLQDGSAAGKVKMGDGRTYDLKISSGGTIEMCDKDRRCMKSS